MGDESFQQANNENTFSSIGTALRSITIVALIIGVSGLVFQFAWEKFTANKKGFIKLIPAPLVVVLLGIGINELFRNSNGTGLSTDHMVNLPMAGTSFGIYFVFYPARLERYCQ